MKQFLILFFLSSFSILKAQSSTPNAVPDLTTDPKSLSVDGSIVVTAASLPEPTEKTVAAVTVISREQIEERKARDLSSLLREVPGISVSRSGSEGKATSLFTRGASSTQTLVLWNGVQLNNPYFSGYDWGHFSTAGVQQVEIVRGPYSALYGSEAMAGVVNVLTASRGNELTVDVQSGERALRNGLLDASFSKGPFRGSGSVERRNDDGFRPNDDFRQTAANAALDWSGPAGLTLGVQGRHVDFKLGIPTNVNAAGTQIVPSLLRRQSGTEQQVAIPIRQSIGRFAYELIGSQSLHRDDFNDPEDPFGFTTSLTESKSRRLQGSLRVATLLGTLIGGGDLERSRVDDSSTFGANLTNHRREGTAFFFEDRYSRVFGASNRLDLNAGIRRDTFSGCEPQLNAPCLKHDLGSQTSPRIGAAFTFGEQKVRFSYGRGFRAPSLGELYFPYSGNKDLDAERSENWELGYDHFFGPRASLSATIFDSRYRNLIQFDNATYAFANLGRARSRGIELGAGHSLGAFRAGLAWTLLRTREEETGQSLLRRPRSSGSVNLSYDWAATTTTLVIAHSGRRADILPVAPYSRISNDAHTTADVMVQLRYHALNPYLRIENLTDEQYEEVRGYASPGRRALIGLRYTLK